MKVILKKRSGNGNFSLTEALGLPDVKKYARYLHNMRLHFRTITDHRHMEREYYSAVYGSDFAISYAVTNERAYDDGENYTDSDALAYFMKAKGRRVIQSSGHSKQASA